MWNPFKKQQSNQTLQQNSSKAQSSKSDDSAPGMPKMNMLQRLAMKKLQSMSPAEQEKLMRKVLTPENVAKHKKEIIAALEHMRSSGQINDAQYQEGKKRLGLF